MGKIRVGSPPSKGEATGRLCGKNTLGTFEKEKIKGPCEIRFGKSTSGSRVWGRIV